jgi:hypothetical protein
MDHISYGEAHRYQGMLIRCQSNHANYACSCGRIAMSCGDGMGSCTQVPAVRCVWAPVGVSYCARH